MPERRLVASPVARATLQGSASFSAWATHLSEPEWTEAEMMNGGGATCRRRGTAWLVAATVLLLPACSASKASNRVHAVTENSTAQNAPPAAHYVWCSDPFGCYESAALLCAPEVPDASSAPKVSSGALAARMKQVPQEAPLPSPDPHPKRENYRQIAEPGMSAPRVVRDGNEWRIMIVCDPGA
jgi:hypothetical protein